MTFSTLTGKWTRRDHLYALRKFTLDYDEVSAVRDWRMREASDLTSKSERASARWLILNWHAPALHQTRTSAA